MGKKGDDDDDDEKDRAGCTPWRVRHTQTMMDNMIMVIYMHNSRGWLEHTHTHGRDDLEQTRKLSKQTIARWSQVCLFTLSIRPEERVSHVDLS